MADKTPIDSSAGKKLFKTIAQELIDTDHPGDHNQALMEIGALVCSPKKPNCAECPLHNSCLAHHQNEPLINSKEGNIMARVIILGSAAAVNDAQHDYTHFLLIGEQDSPILVDAGIQGYYRLTLVKN